MSRKSLKSNLSYIEELPRRPKIGVTKEVGVKVGLIGILVENLFRKQLQAPILAPTKCSCIIASLHQWQEMGGGKTKSH